MENKTYKISNTQNNIWLVDQHYPNTNINSIIGLINFKQRVDVKLLEKAINILVEKNTAHGGAALRNRVLAKAKTR